MMQESLSGCINPFPVLFYRQTNIEHRIGFSAKSKTTILSLCWVSPLISIVGEIAGCNSYLCFSQQLIPFCPSGQNNASIVQDLDKKMENDRGQMSPDIWTTSPDTWTWVCSTQPPKTLKKFFLVSIFLLFCPLGAS